ncbi:MAG TPA: hypothetical protein VH044_03705, partial [Polyangiaceae bacterium]|nr:hypothetical protein [Polyangiaceae bacterium]
MGRLQLFAFSLGAHALLGVALGSIPPGHHREVIAISMAETRKPKVPPHVEPPHDPDPPTPAPRPARAKTAPPAAKAEPAAPTKSAPGSRSLDALPDFGLSLSGGTGGGMAIPGGGGGGPRPAVAPAAAKVLARAPKADECGEPPAKPKLLSRPNPAYTDAARAAGVSGKVRVEITVDEQGRVVA